MNRRLSAKWLLTVVSFFGAFLLFTVELMVANLLTPRFGGGAITWLTALMVFQVVLFGGYAYAHFFAPRLKVWHLVVIGLAGLMLPVSVDAPLLGAHPVVEVVWSVSCAVLLPFFVLSTTSVITQLWWAHSDETEGEPYPLYAASNLGSALALISYPLVIGPMMGLDAQRWAWTILYLVFWFLVAFSWFTARPKIVLEPDDGSREESSGGQRWVWLVLSMLPSAYLLAVTNHLASEIGSFPLLWVLPLFAYLLSFILVFGERVPLGWTRMWWPEILVLGFLAPTGLLTGGVYITGFVIVAFFLICTAVHYFLYLRRPPDSGLTRYFLWVSAGGAIGGIVGNLFPPFVFPRTIEYFVLLLIFAGVLALWERQRIREWLHEVPLWTGAPRMCFWTLPLIPLLIFVGPKEDLIHVERNVYGSIQILEFEKQGRLMREMLHGNTSHGTVFMDEERALPLSYYHRGSGVYEAHAVARQSRSDGFLNMGVIGLGAGSMAEYVQPGDAMKVYELNQLVVDLARDYFPFLKQSRELVEIEVGDGLLLLRDSSDMFDVLTIDAFSGDAIPLNLVTLEAIGTYLEHLNEGGVLVFHVTNRYFQLIPILGRAASALGLPGAFAMKSPNDEASSDGADVSDFSVNWTVAFSRDPKLVDRLVQDKGWSPLKTDGGEPWTDDLSNPLEALIFVRKWTGS